MTVSKLAVVAAAVVATTLLAHTAVQAADIGTHLSRTYGLFKEVPLTASAAQAGGWSAYGAAASGQCDPVLGFTYAQSAHGAGPSKGSQSLVSYTSAGQLNGFGVRVWGTPSSQLIGAGYWRAADNSTGGDAYDLWLTTRDASLACSNDTAPELIGDQMNIWGSLQSIALNMSAAEAEGWVYGDCIPKMGIHHAYDLNAPGSQTFNWQSLVPVQPMYDAVTHQLNAVLVNFPSAQLVEPFGEMEGPFINALFCKNWCAKGDNGAPACSFSGVTLWSTIHFHIVPIDSISCSGAKCNL